MTRLRTGEEGGIGKTGRVTSRVQAALGAMGRESGGNEFSSNKCLIPILRVRSPGGRLHEESWQGLEGRGQW